MKSSLFSIIVFVRLLSLATPSKAHIRGRPYNLEEGEFGVRGRALAKGSKSSKSSKGQTVPDGVPVNAAGLFPSSKSSKDGDATKALLEVGKTLLVYDGTGASLEVGHEILLYDVTETSSFDRDAIYPNDQSALEQTEFQQMVACGRKPIYTDTTLAFGEAKAWVADGVDVTTPSVLQGVNVTAVEGQLLGNWTKARGIYSIYGNVTKPIYADPTWAFDEAKTAVVARAPAFGVDTCYGDKMTAVAFRETVVPEPWVVDKTIEQVKVQLLVDETIVPAGNEPKAVKVELLVDETIVPAGNEPKAVEVQLLVDETIVPAGNEPKAAGLFASSKSSKGQTVTP